MKQLTRKGKPFKGLTVGLDLHKKFIEYSVLDKHGENLEGGKIGSTREALRALIAKLQKHGAVQVSLEACGCFIWVYDLLAEVLEKSAVHVAQAARIRVIADSMEKNDANDAWWLAYLLYERRLPEAFVAEGALRDLRIASRELRSYTDLRSDLLRRFKSHLAQEGRNVPKNWHASKVGRMRAKEVVAQVKDERAKALRALLKQIGVLGRQVRFWRARVVELSRALPAVKALIDNLPGFGEVVAGSVVAELGEPARYYSQKAYAKATGLTPGYRETGGKSMPVKITRQGSRHARWAFTRAVLACMRCKRGVGVQIKEWVRRRTQYKPKRKIIVAAARKLAEGVWRLFALGEVFDLGRAFPVGAHG